VHHPGRSHPDANVFRRLQQRLCETGRVNMTAPDNAGCRSAVRTPGHEDAIIVAVARETWRSTSDITRDFGVSLSKFRSLHLGHQLDPYHFSRNASIFPHDIPLTILRVTTTRKRLDNLIPSAISR